MKIIFKNKQEFSKTLERIKSEDLDNLHFLADFDNTLTKAFVNWQKTPSLVSAIRWKDWMLWEKCALEDTILFEKYHPIEINPDVSFEEKKNIWLSGGKKVLICL